MAKLTYDEMMKLVDEKLTPDMMFGMNMAIYVEENEQGISKNLEKRRGF